MKKRKDKLIIKQRDNDKRWTWTLVSAYNGEIKCAGQPHGYVRKATAIDGWESVCNSAIDGIEIVIE